MPQDDAPNNDAPEIPEPTTTSGRVALGWIPDEEPGEPDVALEAAEPATEDDVTPEPPAATVTEPAVAAPIPAAPPLPSPPRKSKVPLVVVPIALVAIVAASYTTAAMVWPLTDVTPTVTTSEIPALTSPAAKATWPEYGSAAVGVQGFSKPLASGTDSTPMASITKLITALLVLQKSPLAPGESGPSYTFTSADMQTYYRYLNRDESALKVPIDGTLTQFQLLQGMLIASAGNYADRLVTELWPSTEAYVADATAWLAKHKLTGITVTDATGIDPTNVGDPADLVALAKVALKNPVIAGIVRTPSTTLPGAGDITNTNTLLTSDPTIVGLKTGSLYWRHNLVAAKQTTVDGILVNVYAAVLDQTDAQRFTWAQSLLDATAAQIAPTTLKAGTQAGTVTTPWGTSSKVVTKEAASVLAWNGSTAEVVPVISLATRNKGDQAGSATVKGPLNDSSTPLVLSGSLGQPDAWWRLTHPAILFGWQK